MTAPTDQRRHVRRRAGSSTTPTPTCSRRTGSTRPTPIPTSASRLAALDTGSRGPRPRTARSSGCAPPTTPATGRPRRAGDVLLHKNLDALGAFDPGDRVAALDHLGFQSQLIFTTHVPGDAARSSTAATTRSSSAGATRAHNRGMVDFCSVDRRLLPVVLGAAGVDRRRPSSSAGRRSTLGAAALMIPSICPRRQGPHATSATTRCGRPAQEAGVPIVFHVGGGRPIDRDVQGERPAAGARLPRRRRQLHVGVVHGDPRRADADARHDDLRRRPRPLPDAAHRRHRAGRAVAAGLDAVDGLGRRARSSATRSACRRSA